MTATADYIVQVQKKLEQEGCIEFSRNSAYDLRAHFTNFDWKIGVIPMRGEAFFLFKKFDKKASYQNFSEFCTICFREAQASLNKGTHSGALYNAKVPTSLVFSVAIIENESDIAVKVQTTNPSELFTEAAWYVFPVVFCLSNGRLYFYQAQGFLDMLKGEIAWIELRKITQRLLS